MQKTQHSYTWFDDFLCTGFYSGHLPFAPGTMGALLATLLWLLLAQFVSHAALQVATSACIVLFTLAAVSSIRRIEKEWGTDPSRVVVDEMVGVWIALLAVPPAHEWWAVVAAFVLFRLFDIFKPLGVRRMEALPHGWGVMMDDILAGIYSWVVLMLVNLFLSLCS